MSYRTYITRACQLVFKYPLLSLLGLGASGACIVTAGVIYFFIIRFEVFFDPRSILAWQGMLALLVFCCFAALGRYLKIVLVLHLTARLGIKRVSDRFSHAPEEQVWKLGTSTFHAPLFRESFGHLRTICVIHGLVILLFVLALMTVLRLGQFTSMITAHTITSTLGVGIVALFIVSWGTIATLFVVLYRRSIKVAMNAAGDALLIHVQQVFTAWALSAGVVTVGLLLSVGVFKSIDYFFGSGAALACTVIFVLCSIGSLQVFSSAVLLQWFDDVIKPHEFEPESKTIRSEALLKP